MNLLYFLRTLKRNLLLIIIVPVIFATVVNQLTKDELLVFESETTLFTGLVSGSKLDLSSKGTSTNAANNAFDNLLNLIRSRDVAMETGVRLLAQHLTMEKEDARVLLPVNYEWVNRFVPQYIKDLLTKKEELGSTLANGKSESAKDTVWLSNGDFVVDNQMFHITGDSENIQEIAQRYGISVSSILSSNELNSSELRKGQLINIKSESAALPDDGTESAIEKIGLSKTKVSPYEYAASKLLAYAKQSDTNFIYKLVRSANPYYSISAISKITTRRIQNSDLISIKYSSFDPGICQHTLEILTDVVIEKFKAIKANESDAVVKYFLNEANRTAKRLQRAEDRLLRFHEQNNIINYYEQSKAVAIEKENLDVAYQQEQVRYASSAAVLKRLEEKMGQQQAIQLNTSSILDVRNRLSKVSTQITLTESFKDPDTKNRERLVELKAEEALLKQELTERVRQLYGNNVAVDGIPLNDILSAWLENTIVYEQSRASMKILGSRVREFFEYYKTFAPIGATQKRIEREIDVAEQEYLSLLHSLNMSKLAQQNVELASDLKTIDPPYRPEKPIPGKAKLFVVMAGVAGFFLIVFIIIALDFLNNTIRTPDRLEEFSKLAVIGIIPKVSADVQRSLESFVTEKLISHIFLEICLLKQKLKSASSRPTVVLLVSSKPGEGKSFIGSLIAKALRGTDNKVIFLSPEKDPANLDGNKPITSISNIRNNFLNRLFGWIFKTPVNTVISQETNSGDINPETVYYSIDNNYFNSNSYLDFTTSNAINVNYLNYEYIFIELPSLIFNPYPGKLVENSDIILWFTRSNRVWTRADDLALKTILKTGTERPLAILNGVELDVVEEVLGELPKKRSSMRRFIKRIISFKFHEKENV